jgi:hypothetical protein
MPTEALKFLTKSLKVLDSIPGLNKNEEALLLKVVLLRNIAYFYYRHNDPKLAHKHLVMVEAVQRNLSKNLQDSVDLETPCMMIMFNLFI